MAAGAVYQAAPRAASVVVSSTSIGNGSGPADSQCLSNESAKFSTRSIVVRFRSAFTSSAGASPSSSSASSSTSSSSSSSSFFGIGGLCKCKDRPRFVANFESGRKEFRVNAVTEIAESTGTARQLENDAPSRSGTTSSSSSLSSPDDGTSSRTFQRITNEAELLDGIDFESKAKSLPPRAKATMLELYFNYKEAVVRSGAKNAKEIALEVISAVLDRVVKQFEEPFHFPSYHKLMREPYDYYAFGQNYVRPLLDLRNSYVGNIKVLDEIEGYIKQGHNVFLFANHQTEADPAVMSLILEYTNPYLAESLTYIAGDRVVLDPFCKPFSMGRNLLCVYSKKHISDVPELVDMKHRANTRTMKEMTSLLRKGGQFIWIAPSGGRDRPDPVTSEWIPAPFDAAAVENMRRLLSRMPVPGHMYAMTLLCYKIMPPPKEVEKELGEKRLIGHTGVGLAVGPEVTYSSVCDTPGKKGEIREDFSNALYEIVKDQYFTLRSAVNGEGSAGATPWLQLSQPWFDAQNGKS